MDVEIFIDPPWLTPPKFATLALPNESATPSTNCTYYALDDAICIAFTKLLIEALRSPAVSPLDPPVESTQAPEIEKQPPFARLIPPALKKVVVAVVKFAMLLRERREPGDVVPIPTLPNVSIVNRMLLNVARPKLVFERVPT